VHRFFKLRAFRGFTISELLIASGILAFVLTGLLLVFVNCILLNEANRNLTIAMTHAQTAMEELKDTAETAFSSIVSGTWDNAAIVGRGLIPLSNETIDFTVSGTSTKNVLITVNWRDRGRRDRSTTLQTLITQP